MVRGIQQGVWPHLSIRSVFGLIQGPIHALGTVTAGLADQPQLLLSSIMVAEYGFRMGSLG